VCVCVREREREIVRVCETEIERGRGGVFVCFSVCMRERVKLNEREI